jgi:acetoin utilization protein AcuC
MEASPRRGAFVFTPEAGSVEYGPDHPFDPARAVRVYELCDRYGLLDRHEVTVAEPRAVAEEDLLLAHSPAYLQALRTADAGRPFEGAGRWGLGTQDCPIFPGLYRYAALAAGATLAAWDEVAGGRARSAFNPSGGFHHAFRERAEGFCYINDVAILLKKLRSAGARPAFVDIDAHQPNGVIDYFWEDPEVLVVTFHETPRTLYPFRGHCEEIGGGRGRGYTVNVPLEPGADDEVFRALFDRLMPPILDRFAPDFLVVEIGMDMLRTDPLSHLGLSTNAPVAALRFLKSLGVPCIALGGGGYDARNTVRGWTRAWSVLIDKEPVDTFAGIVGGMMFGPEAEAGTLIDPPVVTQGEGKALAEREAERVAAYLEREVIPIIGSAGGSTDPRGGSTV